METRFSWCLICFFSYYDRRDSAVSVVDRTNIVQGASVTSVSRAMEMGEALWQRAALLVVWTRHTIDEAFAQEDAQNEAIS
jgi:hypothetical protein